MLYNLLQTIKDYKGNDYTEGDPPKTVTWQDVIGGAVNSIDSTTTGEEKAKIYRVTIKAYDKPKTVEYTADEISLILSQLKKFTAPLVLGQGEDFFNKTSNKTS